VRSPRDNDRGPFWWVLLLVFPVWLPPLLTRGSAVTGVGVGYAIRRPIPDRIAIGNWATASFCFTLLQVPTHPDLLETMLT
jgi:hypothetical protein